MSGMIPGVGVPHRKILQRENSVRNDPFFHGDRFSDSSVELSETALLARDKLEKKLSSRLVTPSSSSSLIREKSPKGNSGNKKWGSSKLMSITRSVCCCCC